MSSIGPSPSALGAEQRVLHGGHARLLGAFDGDTRRGEQTGAVVVDAVEGAGTDQRLQHAPVDDALVHAPAELEQPPEGPALPARVDDRLDGRFAGALDGAQSIADRGLPDRHEAVVRSVDVGRQDLEAVVDAVLDQLVHLVGVIHQRREVGGHESSGMMRLHVGGLVGDQRVGGCVRLVEAVAGELLHQVEQLIGLAPGQTVALGAGDEDVAVRGHLLRLLLAHGPPQQIGARPACSRRSPGRSASPAPGTP